MTRRSDLAPFVIAMMLLAATALTVADANAGAWTREPGGLFLKVGVDHWSTGDRLDGSGRRVGYAAGFHDFTGGGGFSTTAVRGYAEYGWRDGWTAIGATSIERREADYLIGTVSTAGLGDLELGMRRRLFAWPLVAAIQADLRVPTFYDANESPALGTGQADVGGRLLVGGSRGPLYLTTELGYVARGGSYTDQMPWALEAGWSPTPMLLVRGELRGSESLGAALGASPSANPATFDPARVDTRWRTLGGGVVLRGTPLDLVFDATHVIDGRNTLAGTRFGVSLWYER